MQKNATPSREQQKILRASGLNPVAWAIQKDKPDYLIVRNRLTGEFRAIRK